MARPREYVERDLLEGAMHIFWRHGYAATTMAQIVEATGVNRASLYAAYPDKRALFLAVIRYYLETVSRANSQVLEDEAPAAANVRRYFARIVAGNREYPPGCLLTHTAAEGYLDDPEVAETIRTAFSRLEGRLRTALERARHEGTLADDCDPGALAAQLVALVQGLRVMTRLGMPREIMEQAVWSALHPLRQ